MKIAIVDYGAGNIQSIKFAFNRLGLTPELTSDAAEIREADKVIFPGVGEASSAMRKLEESGLDKVIPELKQPVLGICLGMQLMCRYTEEGDTKGMGLFDVDVKKFNHGVKVPQIGWNQIGELKSELFMDIPEKAYIYLVHSYYVPLCAETIAVSDYGLAYSSALKQHNFYGVQFHPESIRSEHGHAMLQSFLKGVREPA